MGNWPDYAPGQPVEHSSRRENEINAILKAGNLLSGGLNFARSPQSVRIQAYNATTAEISPGQPVQIDITGTMSGEAFPVVAFDNEKPDAPFGVFMQSVAVNGMAPLVLSGPATVQITGTTGGYAKPIEDGTFERGDEGVRILNITGGTEAVVLLGEYHEEQVGTTYGIETTVDGGTATVSLVSGSTTTDLLLVKGANVNITTNASGQVVFSATGGGGGGVPAGTIIAYAGPLDYMPGESYADQYFPDGYSGDGDIPDGWLHCHGQAVSRTEYSDLFAAIGTVYGAGDGSTTFNLPDFRGSFLRGAGFSAPFDVVGYQVVEDPDEEGEYVDAGYIEINGYEIDSGEAVISGQTVDLAGATITPSGIVLNGTTYDYGDISSIPSGVLEVNGGYISGFYPLSENSGEMQANMGKHLRQELPNMLGSFYGITVGAAPDGATHPIQHPGPFIDGGTTGLPGLLPFPITQSPTYPPYTTGLMITSYPNYDTFDNVQIFGSTSGGNQYQTNAQVTRYDFNAYYGQPVNGNVIYTVSDYIREYGYEPPEEMLTIKNSTIEGYNLPTRHLVHWLIKC